MNGKIALLLAIVSSIGISTMPSSFAQIQDEPISPSSLEQNQDTEDLFCGLPLSSFSKVIDGTSGPDVLRGTSANELIRGFAGDDRIFGNGGNDCLKGYEGNDSIWGGDGDDYILGLGDNDKLVGDAGNDTVFGGDGDDSIWGNAGDDKLVGETGDDQVHGDADNDSVFGNEGEDYLWGGAGNEMMSGGAGNDKLVGDDGDDKMWGGAGEDSLIGLAGNDKLVGDSGNDKMYGNAGDDTIYDDDGNDVLNGGDDFDNCYDVVGTNSIFDCEPVDPKDAANPDFDIRSFDRTSGGDLIMQVYGEAGASVPEKPEAGQLGQVFVYVFVTDNGIWVINAHWECHEGATGCDPDETHVSEWHAEEVFVSNVDGYDNPCVTGIANERPATVDGQLAIVSVPEASKILSVQTAAFDLQTNPDDPQQECVAELSGVFDKA